MNWVSALSEFAPIPVGVVIAAATYFFTKRREREAEWRKEKLRYYQNFIASLSVIQEVQRDDEKRWSFCRSSNDLMLFAPQAVLEALYAYQECTRIGRIASQIEHDDKLRILIMSIRRDVGVSPKDNAAFHARLWAPGQGPGEGTQVSASLARQSL